jgi:hypothetical protein
MADNTNNNQSILKASISDQPSENDYLENRLIIIGVICHEDLTIG